MTGVQTCALPISAPKLAVPFRRAIGLLGDFAEQAAGDVMEEGADTIRERETDVAEEIRRFAPNGVQVFWETLREPDFELAIGALGEEGRMILMAGRDAKPAFPVGPFYVKGCSLHGFAMFKAPANLQQVCASDINHWMTSNLLKAQIDRIMPLNETSQAHRLQEENTVQKKGVLSGKIVLRV